MRRDRRGMSGGKGLKINFNIFIVSFLILFLEIFLIRWISSEIRIFAYLNNLILLACFLGIGWGCYLSRDRIGNILIPFIMLASIAACIKYRVFAQITDNLSGFEDALIWWPSEGIKFLAVPVGIFSTLTLFLMVLCLFMPLGQVLGRLFDEHAHVLTAYSINIGAGILGLWFFNGLSFLSSPPSVWVAISVTLMLILVRSVGYRGKILLPAFLLSVCIWVVSIKTEVPLERTYWSVYQKLTLVPNYFSGLRNGYMINVNNAGYMSVLDLSDDFIRQHPAQYDYNLKKYGQYDIPYLFKNEIKDVLIVGAGAGNDAAGALRNTSAKIDAVEIDPVIYRLGLEFHPEKPYQNQCARVFIDDARSFFKKSKKKYDLISFGLLDSVTLGSSYVNTRLDHYVYTLESFYEARRLLKDDGVMTVVFEVKRPWIGARIKGLLQETFGQAPLVLKIDSLNRPFGLGGTMFVAANRMATLKNAVTSNPGLRGYIENNKTDFIDTVKLTSDDWPYLYLKKPLLPRLHICIILVIIILFISVDRALLKIGRRMEPHFFFLGAAFLLLEFQNVSKTALLFGSTWLVNSYTISTILFLILCANIYVAKTKTMVHDTKIYYILLLATLAANYLLPLRFFNLLVIDWQKILVANVVLNLPVFFAGIIFAHSFRSAEKKNIALGANLLGAMTGGVLESASFIFGIKLLLLVVIVLYSLSYLTRHKLKEFPKLLC